MKQIWSEYETNMKWIELNLQNALNWGNWSTVIYTNFFFSEANSTETRLGDNPLSEYKAKLP